MQLNLEKGSTARHTAIVKVEAALVALRCHRGHARTVIGEVADVADGIANMQVPLHITEPHSPQFSRASDARKEVELCVESPRAVRKATPVCPHDQNATAPGDPEDALKKTLGTVTTYHGDEHRHLRGHQPSGPNHTGGEDGQGKHEADAPLAQSTLSQHLKIMTEAGLLQGEVDGPRVCYCLSPRVLRRFKALVGSL